MIRSGALSPLELVEAYLERIGRFDDRLNAFVTVTGERAVARARELEAELAGGRWRGPLHGIPIALKDNIDTAGVLTTAASAVYADRVPDEDAEVVTRLEAAGAVIVGKLNMHEFAYGGTSAFTHTGPVRNPWDVDRIAGGSSGGSGAAVAARLCAGALGTDTGRVGAHSGRPLRHRRSEADLRAGQHSGHHPAQRVARSRGPDVPDGSRYGAPCCRRWPGTIPRGIASIRAEVPDYASALLRRTSSLRLGVPRAFYDDLDPQVAEAVDTALGVLSDSGREHAGRGAAGAAAGPSRGGSRPTPITPTFSRRVATCTRRARWRASRPAPRCPRRSMAEALYQLKLVRKAIASVFDDIDPAGHADVAATPGRDRGGPRIAAGSDPGSDSQHGALQ